MARRIDIELTSSQPDGTWTWRAAGALQPRGVLDGSLLHSGAKPGDVVKADAEFEIDGITVVSVLPPRAKHRSEPERIELLASSRETPGVTTQLAGRGDRRGPGRGERRGPRSEPGSRAGTSADRSGGPRERRDGRRPGHDGAARERGAGAASRSEHDGPSADGPAKESAGQDRSRGGEPRGRDRSGRGRPAGEGRPATPSRSGRRLNPGDVHRRAVLDSLPPEHRPVAEQLLRGGIPAVRTAIHLERDKALAEGRPAPGADSLISLAESMLPRLKAAEWLDRAEAARKAGDEIGLRDLRSVVTSADLARDDEARALAASLRENLEARLARLLADWTAEIRKHLDEHRVVRALRLAGRPPEPTTRLDADLATRLVESASAALGPDTSAERWIAVLEAVAASPVSRTVKPAGLPSDPPEALLVAARQQLGRVPALAGLLGVRMPPPPGPVRAPGSTGAAPPAGRRNRQGHPESHRSPTPPPPPAPAPAVTPERAETAPIAPEQVETGPAVAPEPATASEPVTASEPATASQTVTAPEPATASETATVAEPAPVVTPEPAAPGTGGLAPTSPNVPSEPADAGADEVAADS